MNSNVKKKSKNNIYYILDSIYICSAKKKKLINNLGSDSDDLPDNDVYSSSEGFANRGLVDEKIKRKKYYEDQVSSKGLTAELPTILFSDSERLRKVTISLKGIPCDEIDSYSTAIRTANNGGAFEVIHHESSVVNISLFVIVPYEESLSIWWESIIDLKRKLIKFGFYEKISIVYLLKNSDEDWVLRFSRKVDKIDPFKIEFTERAIKFSSFLNKNRGNAHIWVISDFISNYWFSEDMSKKLSDSKQKKIALVSLLPKNMWPQSALKFFKKELISNTQKRNKWHLPLVSFSSNGILSAYNYYEDEKKSLIYGVKLDSKLINSDKENKHLSAQEKVELFYSTYSLNAKRLMINLACGKFRYTLRQIYILSINLDDNFEPHNSIECVYGNLMSRTSDESGVYIYSIPGTTSDVLLDGVPILTRERISKKIKGIIKTVSSMEDIARINVSVREDNNEDETLIPYESEVFSDIDRRSNVLVADTKGNESFSDDYLTPSVSLVSVIGNSYFFSKVKKLLHDHVNIRHYTKDNLMNADIENNKGLVLMWHSYVSTENIKILFRNSIVVNVMDSLPTEHALSIFYYHLGVFNVSKDNFYTQRFITKLSYNALYGYDIFISHGADSLGESRRLIAYLKELSSIAIPFVNFRYDFKTLERGDSIADFMEEIQSSNAVLLIINDRYLYSEDSMKEFSGLLANSESLKEKVFPLILDSAIEIIHDAIKINALYTHWLEKKKDIEKSIQLHGDSSGALATKLNLYADITEAVLSMSAFLNNLYYLPLDLYKNERFSPLFWEIDQRLKSKIYDYISVYTTEKDMRSALAKEENHLI